MDAGRPAVLCTLVHKEGSGPRDPGSKMLVTSSGEALGTIGGGGMERRLIDEALEALREGEPRTLHFAMGVPAREGMISVNSKCGGEVKIFMDVLKPESRLIIMGSGLIAQAVARYSIDCGFHVTVVDDADTATTENFSGVELVNDAYPESLTRVKIRSSDYVAMLHGETEFELAGLRHAVKARPAFIGLLGSRNKAKEHERQLKEEGYDPETVDAIRGPIGLEIDAETPEEIAVSIVAELIKVKRG
ncbi:MAG TPA: XdhC family protein [Candidatus Krumholzibacteriaceae bacterium]|nr:XdhC family protein [Candidatus Krumholzibacteriaceae bacterium]